MNGPKIALLVFIVVFFIVIIALVFTGHISGFRNLTFKYQLPVLGTIPNLQMATVARMDNKKLPPSSEEIPSSEESSSEIPSSEEIPVYSGQSLLIGLYANEKRNMNPFGNYKIISAERKQESEKIDNLLQRLHNASNSAMI